MDSVFIFIGGGLGALSRWGVSRGMLRLTQSFWPSTLIVNVLGSVVIFLLYKYFAKNNFVNHFFVIGFLGAFTTFSTFSLDLVRLYSQQKYIEISVILLMSVFVSTLVGVYILKTN